MSPATFYNRVLKLREEALKLGIEPTTLTVPEPIWKNFVNSMEPLVGARVIQWSDKRYLFGMEVQFGSVIKVQ